MDIWRRVRGDGRCRYAMRTGFIYEGRFAPDPRVNARIYRLT